MNDVRSWFHVVLHDAALCTASRCYHLQLLLVLQLPTLVQYAGVWSAGIIKGMCLFDRRLSDHKIVKSYHIRYLNLCSLCFFNI